MRYPRQSRTAVPPARSAPAGCLMSERAPLSAPLRVGRALGIIFSAIALVAFLAPAALASKGQFHVSCRLSHAVAADPIVSPGVVPSAHLHDFFANTSTNASSSYRSMRRASTTCSFSADTSGYWTPALVDRSGGIVTPVSMTAYYLASGQVTAPPKNLRIIAGGDTRRLEISGYTCGDGGATSSVPIDCRSGWLKGVVVFPSCWDGRNIDSADHRSHMAYPSGKGCPKSHPVRIPKIVFHFNYGVHNGVGYTLVSDKMMGMSNGMSLHADFWNTWDQSTLEQEVASCLNAGGSCDLGD